MIYIYILLFLTVLFIVFKFFALKRKKPKDVSMNMYYRIQEHPGQYSGSLSATHGTFIFRGERSGDDVVNIVVRGIRCMDQKVEVKLQQILVLAFKANENISTEVSVRFRIGSGKSEKVDLTNYKVKINAVVNYQGGEKKVFKALLPMMGIYSNHHSGTYGGSLNN